MTSGAGSARGEAPRRGQPPRVRPSTGQVVGSIVLLSLVLIGLPLVALPAEGLDGLGRALTDLLRGRIGPASISAVLFVVAWIAWLQFATCAVVEGRSLVRQSGIPPRVPIATWRQQEFVRTHVARVVHGLVRRPPVPEGELAPIPSRSRPHDPLAATADSARRTRNVRRGRSNPDVVAAPLLAAAVLGVVEERRADRAARRQVGQRPPVPQGALADVEVALRLGADRAGADFVDRTLRWVSDTLAEAGRPPLLVVAARLSPQALELRTWSPRRDLPHPWIGDRSGVVWTLARDVGIPAAPSPSAPRPAPVPALVTIGSDGRGVVLVDLEASGGLVTVAGEPDRVRCVLSSIAVELATSTWSRESSVTMVGFTGVSGLADAHVSTFDSFAAAWPQIEGRLAAGRGVLQHYPGQTAQVVRAEAPASDVAALRPDLVVMASPLSVDERSLLAPWLEPTTGRAPLVVVAPERAPVTSRTHARGWGFDLSDDGVLSSTTLKHRVGAQALSPHALSAVSHLVKHASIEPTTRRGSGSRVITRSLSQADIVVLVHLFGEPSASGDIGPGSPHVVEIAAFLALRESATVDELAAAVWPDGIDDAECRDALRRAQWWLGLDSGGRPRLVIDGDMLHLSAEVQADWTLIMAHAWRGVPMDVATLIGLLRGRPAGSEYSWLAKEPAAHEIESVTVDVCAATAQERLAIGDWRTATEVIMAGLRVCPDADPLTRLLQGARPVEAPSLVVAATDQPTLERAWL